MLLGQTAVSLATAFTAQVSIPGVGKVNIDPKAALEQEARYLANKDKDGEILGGADFDSLYFDLHAQIEAITGRDAEDGSRLNLLFLIDDLDRCLPEKAVQVMESVKMFLAARGCAFVLALDKDVIERGIEHCYRDYLFAHRKRRGKKKAGGQRFRVLERHRRPADNRAEYLEKIIQLPIHLPRPTRGEVENFLRGRFASLFVTSGPGRAGEKPADEGPAETPVFTLFSEAVPAVPRKLVRAATLFKFLGGLAVRRETSLEEVTLARLVLLQLFAPELYLFARTREGHAVLQTLEFWKQQHGDDWGSRSFLIANIEQTQKRLRAIRAGRGSDGDASAAADEYTDDAGENVSTLERELAILEFLARSSASRGEFDPRKIIDLKYPSDKRIARYFSFFEEVEKHHRPPGPPAETMAAASDDAVVAGAAPGRPDARIDNENEFIDQLAGPREDAWVNAIQSSIGPGEAIPERLFERLLQRLDELPSDAWLDQVGPVLSAAQAAALRDRFDPAYREHLQRIQALVPGNTPDTGFEPGPADIKANARAGRIVGWLGDPRPGTGLRDDGLPDIDWVQVAKPNLAYQLNKEKKEFEVDANGEYRLDDAFDIARYPVTWRQFQAFVEHPRGYTDARWREELGCEESYFRLEAATWPIPNHPRETVNWYQCAAFCLWLTAELRSIGKLEEDCIIRLPTEWEWQYAATGGEAEYRYPWGRDYKPGHANIDEARNNDGPNNLQRTTAVGLYPWGATQHGKPSGLLDLSGNVWEWCYNRHDLDDENDTIRALRGGGWFNGSDGATCRARLGLNPDGRGYVIGFRLVCVPSISDR